MQTVEELRAKHAAELQELTASLEVANALPAYPKQALFGNRTCPWVTYEVANLREAYELAKLFVWHPYAYAKDRCFAYLRPAELLDENKMSTLLLVSEGTPYLRLTTYDTKAHRAELIFFTKVLDKLVRATIVMSACPWHIRVVKHGEGKYHKDTRKDYPSIGEDRLVSWYAEPTSAEATYLWLSSAGYEASVLPYVLEQQ